MRVQKQIGFAGKAHSHLRLSCTTPSYSSCVILLRGLRSALHGSTPAKHGHAHSKNEPSTHSTTHSNTPHRTWVDRRVDLDAQQAKNGKRVLHELDARDNACTIKNAGREIEVEEAERAYTEELHKSHKSLSVALKRHDQLGSMLSALPNCKYTVTLPLREGCSVGPVGHQVFVDHCLAVQSRSANGKVNFEEAQHETSSGFCIRVPLSHFVRNPKWG